MMRSAYRAPAYMMRSACFLLLLYGSFARMLPVHLRPASGVSERILSMKGTRVRALTTCTHLMLLTMKGNLLPMGIFYTTVSVGTPPREFPVTVDTGSTDMLLPVAGKLALHTGSHPVRPRTRA
jgi:hypothetical protein